VAWWIRKRGTRRVRTELHVKEKQSNRDGSKGTLCAAARDSFPNCSRPGGERKQRRLRELGSQLATRGSAKVSGSAAD
jgi:hypothetical protein